MLKRPNSDQFDPYFLNYINLGPDNILDGLEHQLDDTISFFKSVPVNKLNFAYDDGKWTIKELFGHIIDTERVFAYRALRFSRKDRTPLSGFEENDYIKNGIYNDRTIKSLLEEYEFQRKSTLHLFINFAEGFWETSGIANGAELCTSAIPYIIYGHEEHHKKIIWDRYL